jgi:alpha-galactosidase
MDSTLDAKALEASLACARDWAEAVIRGDKPDSRGVSVRCLRQGLLPFSFRYGGRSAAELVSEWTKASRTSQAKAGVTTHDVTWRDPATGLECVLEMRTFAKAPAVEWAMRVRNTGKQDTPLLSDLRSLDLDLSPPAKGAKATIHAVHACGNGDQPFALDRVVPERGTTWRTGNAGGGKTWAPHLPFLNLELGGRGLFCGLGWPGRWTLAVEHRDDASLKLTGGIERAELSLHPGEEISLPTVLLMFWDGDRLAAHNRFRQHILQYHSPTCDGQPAPDLLACATWGGMKTHHHLRLIEALKQRRTKFDCYWIDAGWYGAAHETEEYQSLKTEDWFFHVGDWRPNALVHPHGLKPISDAAHAAGMKFLLWFEVERAIASSPWVQEHPDWYFATHNTGTLAGRSCTWAVFNFGNPEARQAMTEHMAQVIAENGIDVFRQDCNVGLAGCWDQHDTPGRVGLAEIRYVEGLLAFWDGLKQRFPHLLFDLVQRRDLASLARSLDMSRSDHEFLPHTDSISSQAAQFGLSHWTPLSGTAVPYHPGQDYVYLSGLSSSFATSIFPAISYEPIRVEPPADYPWDWLKRMLDRHRRARPFFRGDFYPLLEHVHSTRAWGAVQYHRPDLGEGMLLAFRRQDSPFVSAEFRLNAIDPAATYELTDTDTNRKRRVSGRELTEKGLTVNLKDKPGAAVIVYRRVTPERTQTCRTD